MKVHSSRRTLTVVLASAVLASAACARRGGGDIEISARGVALDIAFANKELMKPVEPRVIINAIPAPQSIVNETQPLSDFVTAAPSSPPPKVAPPPVAPSCPAAPPGAAPESAVTLGIKAPPAAGVYARHNVGTVKVSGGVIGLTLPYPVATKDEVSAAREVADPGPAGDPSALLGNQKPAPDSPGSGVFEWEVKNDITPQNTVTNTYRITATDLLLVRRETVNGSDKKVFTPSPPISVLPLGKGEGTAFRSAGVDSVEKTGLTIDGTIEAREAVDTCGRLVDTFRVSTNETFVNLTTGETTRSDQPNLTYYATQLGGLIVKSVQHMTQQARDPATGTPLTYTYDVTSTLDRPEPAS